MHYPEAQNYRFEDIEVDVARGCLVRNGEERHLRQQAFQVLVYLLDRRERLVSKAELFDSVWNNTAVTDDVLVQCVTEIRRAIGDDPHRPRFIKTIPKSGYRFIGEVKGGSNGSYTEEITHVEFEIEEEIQSSSRSDLRSLSIFNFVNRYVAIGSAIVLLGAIFYFAWPKNSGNAGVLIMDGRTTVAVMYFENQSNSVEFDWMREGLADMLNAGLSRSDRVNVLSRDRLHALMERGKTANMTVSDENVMNVARQSKADYVVSGSFAQIGESIRVDIRLYEVKADVLLATESLTVDKAERLLSEIDLLSLKLSNRLRAAPNDSRDIASLMTNDLEAYRYYSIAVEKAHALKTVDAVELLQKAVARDPEFAMAHARIGYAYAVTAGKLEEGKPYLERAFQLSSRLTEKDRMNIAAWYAIANKDFELAVTSYRQIIQRSPFEMEAYFRLGRLLAGEERFDEAIEVLRQGMVVDPESKDLYNTMGTVLSYKGDHPGAIAAHERYVALAPNEPNAYDSLGLSYQWAGDLLKAVENYDQALKLDPHFEIAIIHLANTWVRMGQYARAVETFSRYIDTVPNEVDKTRGLNGIAYVYLNKGDLSSAAEVSARSTVIRNDIFSYEYLISWKLGDRAKAKRLERTILAETAFVDRGTRANQRFEPYFRGMIALNNGKNDEAIEHFRETLTHPPPTWHHEDYEDCLGLAFLRLGRFDEAIAEFERILQINPNYPLVRFRLGEAYRSKGMADEARRNYSIFLDSWSKADIDVPEVAAAHKYLEYRW